LFCVSLERNLASVFSRNWSNFVRALRSWPLAHFCTFSSCYLVIRPCLKAFLKRKKRALTLSKNRTTRSRSAWNISLVNARSSAISSLEINYWEAAAVSRATHYCASLNFYLSSSFNYFKSTSLGLNSDYFAKSFNLITGSEAKSRLVLVSTASTGSRILIARGSEFALSYCERAPCRESTFDAACCAFSF